MTETSSGERLQTKYTTQGRDREGRVMVGNVVLGWIAENSPGTQIMANDDAEGRLFFTFEPPLGDQINALRRHVREYAHDVSTRPIADAPATKPGVDLDELGAGDGLGGSFSEGDREGF